MRQGSEKFYPGLLSQEQKELRVSTSLELHDRASSDSVSLRSLITRDKFLVCGYDPEKKMQNSDQNRQEQTSTSIETKCENYVDRFYRY
jgi:hypothetical protein